MNQFKVIIVGDSSVGKSSIAQRYTTNQFSVLYKPTIGADILSKLCEVSDQKAKLQIWDTAGQESWSTQIGSAYYRGADVAVIVFDLGQNQTLQNVHKWYLELKSQLTSVPPIILVGNKSDRDSEVTEKQILAVENQIKAKKFMKCSAKTGENIDNLFAETAKICLENADKFTEQDEVFVVKTETYVVKQQIPVQKKTKKCC
ncbi:Rab1a [Hexamita inflata]|uniref:Rab1a n=1 Tax=Hexamita inflata TaxID=28002 RepID=A0AA86PKK5_9EUKA|nr:Rab1a [Hexamita inflata]